MGVIARREIKEAYGIKDDLAEDFCIYCCCLPCALTQERR